MVGEYSLVHTLGTGFYQGSLEFSQGKAGKRYEDKAELLELYMSRDTAYTECQYQSVADLRMFLAVVNQTMRNLAKME